MIRLAVRCDVAHAEAVLAELVQLAPGGVEEDRGAGWVEYAIYGVEGELPDLGAVTAVTGDDLVEIRAERVPDDWADRWRDFHEPTVIADRVVIRPSWHDNPVPGGLDIVIDPGQAFGTGAHPTTRMCVELMLELERAGLARGSLTDLGTGSGVLAIAAGKLGWDPVVAVDSERAALDAAAANAKENRADLELRRMNLREEAPPSAETIVANLTAPLLIDVAQRLERTPQQLVCSGLLQREAEAVAGALADAGLSIAERRVSGDWTALLLTRVQSIGR